jgi:hypothetical protein
MTTAHERDQIRAAMTRLLEGGPQPGRTAR